MDGQRHQIASADSTEIGVLQAGSGPGLLLVHGGMGRLERWEPLWPQLSNRWQVTAMDRRGRGSSGDGARYQLSREFEDVAAVAGWLAERQGEPVHVLGHSFGATCALGAAGSGAPFGKIIVYEPAARQAVTIDWVRRVEHWIASGQTGRAMVSFLDEVVGLTAEQIADLRRRGGTGDVLAIAAATMSREARALAETDIADVAAGVRRPVLLLTGSISPPWAHEVTEQLARVLPESESATLPGQGHEAIDTAPHLVLAELQRFLG